MTDTDPLSGGCACGAVRYSVNAAPMFQFHCQCRDCQRASGTGHGSAMAVAKSAVEISGELRFFDQAGDSGNIVARGFCPTCGSPVLNRNSGYADNLYIHAASLDDSGRFTPSRVVFRASAQPWDHMDPALD